MFRACFLVFLFASVALAQQPANPLGAGSEIVAAGRVAYNQNCTACHGLDGAAGDRAPALAAERSYTRTTDSDLFDAIIRGIPGTGMPALGLSEDEAWRITAFIRSLRAAAADFPPDGDVARGAIAFTGKGECASCHMIGGVGGLIGPDLTNIGAEATVQRIRDALTVA